MTPREIVASALAGMALCAIGLPLLFWVVAWLLWSFKTLLPWPAI